MQIDGQALDAFGRSSLSQLTTDLEGVAYLLRAGETETVHELVKD